MRVGSSESSASRIAPGAGAEIGDPQGMISCAVGAQQFERALHHGLGIGPRHQRCGGEMQRQSPELLDAENARHRFAARGAAARGSRGGRLRRESACALAPVTMPVRSSPSAAPVKKPCIELGGVVAGRLEARRERAPGALDGLAAMFG